MSIASEITRLQNIKSDIRTALSDKGIDASSHNYADFANDIENIQTGGSQSKDINFYDYEGTLLYSYTLAELQQLTELPALPPHEGLTAKGWNWTLADLKTENKPMIVGAHYGTSDGINRFYIHIDEELQQKIALVFRLKGTAEIDWGDGSAIESVSDNKTLTGAPTPRIHEYAQVGDYCISIKVVTGYIGGGYTNYPFLQYAHRESLLPSGMGLNANILLTRIEGGDDTHMDYAWFNAFISASSLQSIAIPSINWWCPDTSRTTSVNDCHSLQFLTIPHGVTSINCVGCRKLKSIAIPKSLTTFANSAFNNCHSLSSITIPSNVTNIPVTTFSNCYSLTSIIIPSSITSIGNNAFTYCSALTSVLIPSGVTSIGTGAFNECHSLNSITIPSSITSIGDNAFYGCSSLTSVIIPSGVTNIGNNVFRSCSSLASITIPSTVTNIGDRAFYGCRLITSITIPIDVTNIGLQAFYYCNSLTSIIIPSGVTSIGSSAFQDCNRLLSVTIPSSITSIGNEAFRDATNIYLYDFLTWTSTDLDACTFGTNIFRGINQGTKIMFKYKSVSDHAATVTNLSTYSAYFTYEEDDT